MYDLKIPEICRGYCVTEGLDLCPCVSSLHYVQVIFYLCYRLPYFFTHNIFVSHCGLDIVWRETAQCHLETSVVFYFEMFQINHTYRNGLVSRETNANCNCDFPMDWYNTYDIDLLRQYIQALKRSEHSFGECNLISDFITHEY